MLVPTSEEKVVTVTFMHHVRPEQIPETISAFADEEEHQEERPRPTQDITTYTIEGANIRCRNSHHRLPSAGECSDEAVQLRSG